MLKNTGRDDCDEGGIGGAEYKKLNIKLTTKIIIKKSIREVWAFCVYRVKDCTLTIMKGEN